MNNQLTDLILDQSKWVIASLTCAVLSVTIMFYRNRDGNISLQRRILAATNLFFGVSIFIMAFGHLMAVTVKLTMSTLEASVLKVYAIGIFLAVPSFWIIFHTRKILMPDSLHERTTLILNIWLIITLLVMGIRNLPLALPGILTIGYYIYSMRMKVKDYSKC